MSEWQEWIRNKLEREGVRLPVKDDAVEELANHIEDSLCATSGRDHRIGPDAVRSMLGKGNWSDLAREIRRARQEDEMNDRVKRVWMPGLAAVALAHGLWGILLAAGLEPKIVWDDSHPLIFLFLPWLLLLPLVGAFAAHWSRRCGGSRRELWMASLLPALAIGGVSAASVSRCFLRGLAHPPRFQAQGGVLAGLLRHGAPTGEPPQPGSIAVPA